MKMYLHAGFRAAGRWVGGIRRVNAAEVFDGEYDDGKNFKGAELRALWGHRQNAPFRAPRRVRSG